MIKAPLSLAYMTTLYKLLVFRNAFKYTPHSKQLECHCSSARFKTVQAGARGGKSIIGGVEGAFQLLFPGRHIWFVSLNYDLADKEFDWMLEFLGRYEWGPGVKLIDICRQNNPSRGQRRIETPWGSWAETRSAKNPENLLGEEIDVHIVGEASQLPDSAWRRYLYPRLGPRKGGAYILSTPNWDSGFLRTMVDCGLSGSPEYSDYETFKFSVLANPTFPAEEYHQAKKVLPREVFLEQYEGEFVSRRGRVFPQFTSENITEEMPGEGWLVYRVLHHEANSFNNPFVCLSVAQDPDTRNFIIYDEYYKAQVLPEDACGKIYAGTGNRLVFTNVSDYYNPTLQETVRKYLGTCSVNDEKGFSRRHAIVRRIQAVQSSLMSKETGPPLVRVHKSCVNTIANFEEAKWPNPKKEETEMAEGELPTTKNMPGPLALSYLISYYMQAAYSINIYNAQMTGRKAS